MRHETDSPAALRRHRAQCQICRHPDCKEIERQFLDWTTPHEIAENYGLGSYRTVYRHAHALGLFEGRNVSLRFALNRLIEHVGHLKPTPSVALGAIRLAYQMNQKQQGQDADNGPSKTLPFVFSLEGLPRTNAVTGYPPETESSVPNAVESESPSASVAAPVRLLPGDAGARRSARPTHEPVHEKVKQPVVSGFVRPWSKRKRSFPSSGR